MTTPPTPTHDKGAPPVPQAPNAWLALALQLADLYARYGEPGKPVQAPPADGAKKAA